MVLRRVVFEYFEGSTGLSLRFQVFGNNYAVSRGGTELLESSFSSTLCLMKEVRVVEMGKSP